ncbi:lipid II:glycine glycyltransferase (peptidoglycan interpeptide bridge formation enzyme) [Pedobacter sp. CG_S7]|uniref:GNAT family N-acetyltransferase n=1 Tax=Pedobacter sp. CG_S7 TaxID=3143930 RepID=UPI00339105A2
MIKIITINQKEEWIAYVAKSKKYDFYHSWTYHAIEKIGSALLFVFEENGDFIALPLFKRKIPDTEYYDLCSAYGYVGPISNNEFEDLNEQFINHFKESLLDFLKEEKIISIFCRLHPFINQNILLQKFGGICANGKVIVLDLSTPIIVQRAKYPKVYSKIKQLKRLGYYLKEANSLEDIKIFITIYEENMIRLNADDSYFFTEEYCIKLLHSKEYEAKLYFVYNENGNPICGTIIVFTNQIIQGHLLATREEFKSVSPAKLLVDEISVIGRNKGMKYYNLGGGLGYKEDSLYNWKIKFSNLTFDHKSWRYIVNPKAYHFILNQFAIDPSSNIDFFPLYRSIFKAV